MTENNTFREEHLLPLLLENTVKTVPPETERGNFWLWGGQSKFKLKEDGMGQSSAVPPQP